MCFQHKRCKEPPLSKKCRNHTRVHPQYLNENTPATYWWCRELFTNWTHITGCLAPRETLLREIYESQVSNYNRIRIWASFPNYFSKANCRDRWNNRWNWGWTKNMGQCGPEDKGCCREWGGNGRQICVLLLDIYFTLTPVLGVKAISSYRATRQNTTTGNIKIPGWLETRGIDTPAEKFRRCLILRL